MKDFLAIPFEVYREDPNWVAPLASEIRRVLDPRRNPYFTNAQVRMFVCYRERYPVARVAIITNYLHWQKFQSKTAFFGFFESLDDEDAVRFMFYVVEQYCRTVGAEHIEGPFNPNHYSELGFQSDHFGEAPTFFQTYSPEYYPGLLRGLDFDISKTVHTRKNDHIRQYISQHFDNEDAAVGTDGYVVRTFRKNDFKGELERIREVFNDAFACNWCFLPLSREEYRFSAKFLNLVTYPELITIVEHHGEPVGVLECVQDVNPLIRDLHGSAGPLKYVNYQRKRKNIRRLIVYAVGIKKSHQRTRVYKFLVDALRRYAASYDVVETTWMSEENALSIRAAERFGLEPDRKFAIYQKNLG